MLDYVDMTGFIWSVRGPPSPANWHIKETRTNQEETQNDHEKQKQNKYTVKRHRENHNNYKLENNHKKHKATTTKLQRGAQ